VKRELVLLAFALMFLITSIFTDEPLMGNKPLLEGVNVIDVYPMHPEAEPVVIEAPEYENDLISMNEIQGISDGTGPVVGTNTIRIYVTNTSKAGSSCDYIYLDFGPDKNLRLRGYSSGTSFPRGGVITWDLSEQQYRAFMESVDQESWDYICLRTESKDGIKIKKIMIYHSSEKILNWNVGEWLSSPDYSRMGLAAKILNTKLKNLKKPTQAAVHYGLRELGKTDGYKYGTGELWCSEFASWCLRKNGWDTPTGSIGTSSMRNFFDNLGRLYTQSHILSGTYNPKMGDYLSLRDGGHSAIFVKWIDDPNKGINKNSSLQTIEGNTGKAVRIRIREVGDIDHVGKAQ